MPSEGQVWDVKDFHIVLLLFVVFYVVCKFALFSFVGVDGERNTV